MFLGQSPHYQHHGALTCHINTLAHSILAHCSARIQVVVVPKDISEVHKLYVAQSMDRHTPVTVPVEGDGEYQVFIFAIREGIGILGTGVGYTQQVTVHTPSMESTTPSPIPGNYNSVEKTIPVPQNNNNKGPRSLPERSKKRFHADPLSALTIAIFCFLGFATTSICEKTRMSYWPWTAIGMTSQGSPR